MTVCGVVGVYVLVQAALLVTYKVSTESLYDDRELQWPDDVPVPPSWGSYLLTVTVAASPLLHIRFGTEHCMEARIKDLGALDASLVKANGFAQGELRNRDDSARQYQWCSSPKNVIELAYM